MKFPRRPMKDIFDFDPRQIPDGASLVWDKSRGLFVPTVLASGGAPTTAKYVTTAADGTLSAEVAIPSLGASADRLVGAGGASDEYNSATLDAAWTETTVGSTTSDIDTTWKSHYYWKGDGSADQSRSLERTLSSLAGVALSVTASARLPGAGHNDANLTAGIYLDKDGTGTDWAAVTLAARLIRLQQRVASVSTDFGTYSIPNCTSILLHIQRTTGNLWSVWYSFEGMPWIRVITNSQAQNVGKLKLIMRNNNTGLPTQQGWDWVRQDWLTL